MRINPILGREVRERMRSMRAPVLITVYLLILGLIVVLAERFIAENGPGGNPFAAAALGRAIFHWLLLFTLVLVCFLVPAFTAGSIASERAGRTLHLLQVTLLKPRQIVVGKLLSSMGFIVLLVLATAPLMSVSFLLGGVTPLDVLRGYGMVLLTGLTFGMLGIAISANLRRPMAATVLTYALMVSMTLGTVLAYGAIRLARRDLGNGFGGGREPMYTLVLNPFVGTASALSGSRPPGFNSGSPFDPMIEVLNRRGFSGGPRVMFGEEQAFAVLDSGPVRVIEAIPKLAPRPVPAELPPPPEFNPQTEKFEAPRLGGVEQQFQRGQADESSRVPVWVSTVLWYVVLMLAGYRLAVIGVRTPMSGIGFGRRRIALGDG